MRSYDYARRDGIHELSWSDIAALCDDLAEMLDREGVESIVGVARAGLFPATSVSLSLRCELYPVRITRRHNDEVVFDVPRWIVPVSGEVAGQSVAVIDEIADSGETLGLVAEAALRAGAARVVTAALVAHPWAQPFPAHAPLVTEAFVQFPWNRQVLVRGEWAPHPEATAALDALSGEVD